MSIPVAANRLALAISCTLALYGCDSNDTSELPSTTESVPTFWEPEQRQDPTADESTIAYNDMAVHDPSVIRDDDGTFYVFGSHLDAAKSTDLMSWERIAGGVNDTNPLFNTYASEISEGIEWVGGHQGSWASDVIKLNDGRYYFYYNHCANPASEAGDCDAPRSYMGVAVSDTIEGPYTDLGIFMRSGMTPEEVTAGYGPDGFAEAEYNPWVHPNAIDPDVFYDKDGKLWMVYGSYSGGIFILEMDETTAMPKPGQGYGQHLTGGDHSAIEGTYMLYSPESDYYYLFMSFGGFVSTDGYNIRVARSKNPNGPFLDAAGNNMADARGNWASIEPYGVKLMGGFVFESDPGDAESERGYLAPGHNSAYFDEETGRHLLITHTRFPNRGEEHSVRVHEMFMNADGWPVVSPHRYAPIDGDNLVDGMDLRGDYKLINHGKDINRTAKETLYVTLGRGSAVTGEARGDYWLFDEDPDRIDLTLNIEGKTQDYRGVMKWQWNAAAGALTPVITAVNAQGESIWLSRMAPRTNSEVLTDIAVDLELPALTKDGTIDMPERGTRAATISWSSDNESVVTSSGRVARPNAGAGDADITITATIERDGQTYEQVYTVHVPERVTLNRTAQFSFENNLEESLGNFAAGTPTGDRIFNGAGSIGYGTGQHGQALQLNGSNGVLLPEGLIDNYEYTVSFWANPQVITGFTTAFFGAVNEQVDENNFPFSNNWVSFLPQGWDGNTMFWSGSEAWVDASAGERIAEGAWTHMAFSVKQGLVSVHLNGEQKFSGGNVTDFFSHNTGKFALGVNYWDLPYNGLIDELKVYDSALSAEEVRLLDIEGESDAATLLASAANQLSLGDTSAVRSNLILPMSGAFASAIQWSSSHASVITINGQTAEVTQPTDGDAEVTLTATLSLNGEQLVKEFPVTVKSKGLPDPVAVFSFEDTLDDATGKHGAGVVTGNLIGEAGGEITYSSGVIGKSAYFNGASGVRLPDNLITSHNYTFSLWLSPETLNPYTPSFFGWATTDSWISLLPNGFGADTMLWSGTAWFDANTGEQIPEDTWSHLIVVVNGGDAKIYINGEEQFSGSNFPDVFSPAASTQFALGVNYWDTPYNGMMDELYIFGEAITAEDARKLYESQLLGGE